MIIDTKTDPDREMILLEQIERDPDITQASLAAQLGVAVGTVNLLIRRLIDKGYVKVKRAQRRKLRYIITPEGIVFRARLTMNYIETSMRLYRRTRQRVSELLVEVRQAGYQQVQIVGDGDIADICRLSCLEHNIKVVANDASLLSQANHAPILEIHGAKVILKMTGAPRKEAK